MSPVTYKATITEISDATEVELRKGRDDDVLEMIMANPKVKTQRYMNLVTYLTGFRFIQVFSALLSSEASALHRCDAGRPHYVLRRLHIAWQTIRATHFASFSGCRHSSGRSAVRLNGRREVVTETAKDVQCVRFCPF